MDPLTLISGVSTLAGIGMKLFGGTSQAALSSQYAQQQAGIQTNIIGLQQQQNVQRQNAMEMGARRQNLENVRNVQKAQAMGQATAVGQGAQFGSGYQGGQGQAAAQGNWNFQGVEGNLLIGRNMFSLDSQLSQQKIQLAQAQAQYQSQSATNSGISDIGSGLISAAPALGRLGATAAPGISSAASLFGKSGLVGWG